MARRPGGDLDQAVQRIRATVDAIPRGKVATYGQVAEQAGLPRRARLVGRVLARLEDGSALPWHRVAGAGGHLRQRSGGEVEQRRRLAREGVRFGPSGRIDLARFGWRLEG